MNKSNLNLLCKTQSTETGDDKLIITGLASSTAKDLDGERVSLKALEQMYNQVKGLSLFSEHEHHLKSILGVITDAELKGEELYITAEILPEHKMFVKGLIDSGISLGFSIGGIAKFDENDKNLMSDFQLLEVSLVSLPANWQSFGTIVEEKSVTCKCLTDGLTKLKKLGDQNMDEDLKQTQEEVIEIEAQPEEEVAKEATEIEEKAEEEITIEKDSSEDEEVVKATEDISDSEEPKEEAKFLTADDIGVILESFMAEKEEQIKADILLALQRELEKKSEEAKEEPKPEPKPEEPEAEEEEEPETEKSVEAEPVAEPVSKYASYTEQSQFKDVDFLNSEERDFLGRNRKYL